MVWAVRCGIIITYTLARDLRANTSTNDEKSEKTHWFSLKMRSKKRSYSYIHVGRERISVQKCIFLRYSLYCAHYVKNEIVIYRHRLPALVAAAAAVSRITPPYIVPGYLTWEQKHRVTVGHYSPFSLLAQPLVSQWKVSKFSALLQSNLNFSLRPKCSVPDRSATLRFH